MSCKNIQPTNTRILEEEETFIPYTFTQPEYIPDDESLLYLTTFESTEIIRQEALKYLAGYIAYRFKDKFNLGTKTSEIISIGAQDWVHFLSTGGLSQPNQDLLNATEILESKFLSLHGTSLSKEENIFKIPYEVIYCLSRTRTYIRLRDLNKQITLQNLKAKMEKNLSKFSNFKKKVRSEQ